MPMQEPLTITLGTEYSYKQRGAKSCLTERSETFQYVPLTDNLEWVLQNSDVYREVSVPFHTHLVSYAIMHVHGRFSRKELIYLNTCMISVMVKYSKTIHSSVLMALRYS